MAQEYTFRQEETGPLPPQQEQQQQERPEWLPEQFSSPEEMAKAWKETQGNYTKARQELAALRGEEAGEEPDQQEEQEEAPQQELQPDKLDEAANKVTEKAGVDVSEYTQEYQTSGDLSPESRDRLAESLKDVLGDNARELVDTYVDAKKAVHQSNTNLYMEEAGGAENYAAMTQWAAQNLSPEDVQAYNAAVNSGNRHTTLFAIRGLRAQYEAAEGREPNLRSGTRTTGVAPFASAAEMRMAMKDPRYKQDEAYREQVQRRLAISEF